VRGVFFSYKKLEHGQTLTNSNVCREIG
jgi:hypothetical protein